MFSITFINMSALITGLFLVNFMIALTIIFLERKNPSATLAWIMILFLVPVAGIIFYFLLSQNIARQRIFRLSKFEEAVISASLNEQIESIKDGEMIFTNPEAKKWQDMIRLHQTYGNAFFTQDNKIMILTDGKHKFDCLLQDIKNATKTINVMYFIVKNDAVGRMLLEALTEKALQGIEVRLLLDAMGSRQISPKILEAFKRAGGKHAYFFPPKFKYLNMKLNYRNHRKLVVIDDEIGYLGGFNVGNEYLGKVKKIGYWRDTHLRLLGSCVQDMNARFILDWRFASKETLVLSQAYYNAPTHAGTTGIQIVSSGPDSSREEVKQGYLKMISSAKKNIYIQTPYFVPDSSILECLKTAVLSGVDVRIMIPCKPDHMFVYWATYSYIGILLDVGAKIYIYDNGFLHAKTLCVDGEVASIGSANFDIRSFRLNFEANAFIYDAAEVYKLEAIFESDMAQSHELTRQLYRRRSLQIKFKESVSRLLSDLL
ncbi:cardiolipin synthase [Sinanaerobacter chloroacetimidivorans]|nr:cardiolipin synthase [Sinanaerobacter chloroacetimidivorans]